MKKTNLLLIASLFYVNAMAEYVLYVNDENGMQVRSEKCSEIDSIKTTNSDVSFHKGEKNYTYNCQNTYVTFEEVTSASDTVVITYNNGISEPTIVNPYQDQIIITTNGDNVSVNCAYQLKDVVYKLQGSSQNGSFFIETPRKFTLYLNNLSLTSVSENSAIRSLSGSTMTVVLPAGTQNTLSDSANDTCNATLRSKGQIVFAHDSVTGTDGSLKVTGVAKRAIQSGDFIQIDGGNIVATASDEAIKANDYFVMNGGTLTASSIEVSEGYMVMNDGTLNCSSDIEDGKLIKIAKAVNDDGSATVGSATNGTLTLNGGTIALEVNGNGAKGIKAEHDIIINGGLLTGTVNGTIFDDVENDDIGYATFAKADHVFNIQGGFVSIELAAAAKGSRALSADSGLVFDNNTNVSINANCTNFTTTKNKIKPGYGIKTDGYVVFNACQVSIVSSQTSNSAISINSVGSVDVNNNALVYLSSASNCNFKETKFVNANGGVVIANAGATSPLESTSRLNAKGGYYIGLGSKVSTLSLTGTTSLVLDNSYTTGSAIQVSLAGESILKFQGPSSSSSKVLQMTMPGLITGQEYTYSIGGTITGGSDFHGFNNGGTYAGGTDYKFTAAAVNANATISK